MKNNKICKLIIKLMKLKKFIKKVLREIKVSL